MVYCVHLNSGSGCKENECPARARRMDRRGTRYLRHHYQFPGMFSARLLRQRGRGEGVTLLPSFPFLRGESKRGYDETGVKVAFIESHRTKTAIMYALRL